MSGTCTLFSKRSAHWFTPVLLVTLSHWPWPRAMSILSNGLDRPIDKIKMTRGRGRWPRDLRKLGWFSCALLSEKSVCSLIKQTFYLFRGKWQNTNNVNGILSSWKKKWFYRHDFWVPFPVVKLSCTVNLACYLDWFMSKQVLAFVCIRNYRAITTSSYLLKVVVFRLLKVHERPILWKDLGRLFTYDSAIYT